MKKVCYTIMGLILAGNLCGCSYNAKQKAVHFDTASYQNSAKDKFALQDMIAENKKNNYSEGYMVHVYGHTDSVGNAEYNQDLSKNRAETIRKIAEETGVQSWRIRPEHYGLEKPIASNSSEKGKALNRRTVVSFLPIVPGKEDIAEN